MLHRAPLILCNRILQQASKKILLSSSTTSFDTPDSGESSDSIESLEEGSQTLKETKDHEKTDLGRVRRDRWSLYKHQNRVNEDIDPSTTTVLLFPGQGSQTVGMARSLIEVPGVARMFQVASEKLRMNLLKACMEGTAENLSRTIVCQPALYVCSLAAVKKLKEEQPEAIERCVAAAGFSVGEIAALVFAGSMTFEEGLHIVRVRAELMQRACDENNSGMATVFLSHDSELGDACMTARLYCSKKLGMQHPVCQVANYLYDNTRVVGGHIEALEFLSAHKKEFRIRAMKTIRVSGAFHTPLMTSVCHPMKNLFERMGDCFSAPAIPVVSNVDALPHTTAGGICRRLTKQIRMAVRWEQTLHNIYARPNGVPFPRTFEVGPGGQLGSMLKVVNKPAFENYKSVL